MKKIAVIHCDYKEKFGIPRQSGIVNGLTAEIVFEPPYRNKEALRGLKDFSHIWLIWEFSKAKRDNFSPTVRPPRLGGNKRMGVFATRSPFRPNPIGLSCVKLLDIREDKALGPVITVAGADLLDGTPIYDIKPYIPYADCRPDATGGFTDTTEKRKVKVIIPDVLLQKLPKEKRDGLIEVLSEDPRPSYQSDSREYGMNFASFNVRFSVNGEILTVTEIKKAAE